MTKENIQYNKNKVKQQKALYLVAYIYTGKADILTNEIKCNFNF